MCQPRHDSGFPRAIPFHSGLRSVRVEAASLQVKIKSLYFGYRNWGGKSDTGIGKKRAIRGGDGLAGLGIELGQQLTGTESVLMIRAKRALQVIERGLKRRSSFLRFSLGLEGVPQGQAGLAADAGKDPRLRRLLEHRDRAARVGDRLVRELKLQLNIRSPHQHPGQGIGTFPPAFTEALKCSTPRLIRDRAFGRSPRACAWRAHCIAMLPKAPCPGGWTFRRRCSASESTSAERFRSPCSR
jgi:hypothetical protein